MLPKTESFNEPVEGAPIDRKSGKRNNGNYKPTTLKWPFIVTQIFLLTHILALVVYVQQLNPDSHNPLWTEIRRRGSTGGASLSLTTAGHSTHQKSHQVSCIDCVQGRNISKTVGKDVEGRQDTTITLWQPTTVTVPRPTTLERTTTQTVTTTFITSYSFPVTVTKSNLEITTWTNTPIPITSQANPYTEITTETVTYSYPVTVTDSTSIFTTQTTMTTTIITTPPQQTSVYITYAITVVETSATTMTTTAYMVPSAAIMTPTTIAITGELPPTKTIITPSPSTRTIVTTDQSGSPTKITTILSYPAITSLIPGKKTTMMFKTVLAGHGSDLSSFTIFTTEPGSPITKTRTPPPFTYVTSVNDVAVTMVSAPPPETFVTTEGATTSALATVVVTPAPNANGPNEQANEGSSVTTIIETQPPSTYITDVSGTPTTMVTTPPPSTRTSTVPISWGPKTITRSAGGNHDPSPDNRTTVVINVATFSLTPAEYFAGAFLPTLLAMLVGIPISLIDINARLMQPFHALTREGGATASWSLDLTFSGFINSFAMPHRLLFQQQPVTYLTSLLTWCSWLLVPLAGEAIGLQVHGRCSRFAIDGCAVALGVSPLPTKALAVLLAIMATLLAFLLYYLRDWKTGVYFFPWSIAGIATLTTDRHLRRVMASRLPGGTENVDTRDTSFKHSINNTRFKLGLSHSGNYGILLAQEHQPPEQHIPRSEFKRGHDGTSAYSMVKRVKTWGRTLGTTKRTSHTPFLCLTYPWRISFSIFHMGVLALVTYYYVAQNTRTAYILGFGPGFGSRFLFSAIGKILSLFWSDFFISESSHICSSFSSAFHLPFIWPIITIAWLTPNLTSTPLSKTLY